MDATTGNGNGRRPRFRVPQWNALFPSGEVARDALCRHVLVLGEPGSGKTASAILPAVATSTGDQLTTLALREGGTRTCMVRLSSAPTNRSAAHWSSTRSRDQGGLEFAGTDLRVFKPVGRTSAEELLRCGSRA